jgi:hypothetical protein
MSSTSGAPVFSREGLLFRRGITGGWTSYNRATAGLPSDTIQALTPADSHSVWIATAAGIFHFTPPNTVTEARSAFNVPVTDFATDSLGRLYIATWGSGVHRWHAGTTQSLGYYSTSSSVFRAGRGAEAEAVPRRKAPGKHAAPEFRTLLGRSTDASTSPGFCLPAKTP